MFWSCFQLVLCVSTVLSFPFPLLDPANESSQLFFMCQSPHSGILLFVLFYVYNFGWLDRWMDGWMELSIKAIVGLLHVMFFTSLSASHLQGLRAPTSGACRKQ